MISSIAIGRKAMATSPDANAPGPSLIVASSGAYPNMDTSN